MVINGVLLYGGNVFVMFMVFIYGSDVVVGNVIDVVICLVSLLNVMMVRGKIVVCECGGNVCVEKGVVVLVVGGVGMIFVNIVESGEFIVVDVYLLLVLSVGFNVVIMFVIYMNVIVVLVGKF